MTHDFSLTASLERYFETRFEDLPGPLRDQIREKLFPLSADSAPSSPEVLMPTTDGEEPVWEKRPPDLRPTHPWDVLTSQQRRERAASWDHANTPGNISEYLPLESAVNLLSCVPLDTGVRIDDGSRRLWEAAMGARRREWPTWFIYRKGQPAVHVGDFIEWAYEKGHLRDAHGVLKTVDEQGIRLTERSRELLLSVTLANRELRTTPTSGTPKPDQTVFADLDWKELEWSDVRIAFRSSGGTQYNKITAEVKGKKRYLDPSHFGLNDARMDKPTIIWKLLEILAMESGVLKPGELADRKYRDNIKAYVSKLRKSLRRVFRLNEDPIPYNRRQKAYIAKFRVSHPQTIDEHSAGALPGDEAPTSDCEEEIRRLVAEQELDESNP